jgi:tetratricopeptide (TPR) repeat protein
VDAYLDSHPHHSRALRLRARALLELERPQDAAHIFYQVGADQPEDLRAWAKAHVRMAQFSQALQILESLQKIEPPSADTLETITFCRYALGQRDAAVDSAQQLADLPGHEATGNLQLALLYRDWGLPSLAKEHFARVLQFRPDATDLRLAPADFFLAYGMAALATGDARQAVEAFERSEAIAPSPDALLLQAEAWQARGDGEKAETLRNQVVRQYPGHPASEQFSQTASQGRAPQPSPQTAQATTASPRSDSAVDDGHTRMRQLLDKIRQGTDTENPYLGKGPLGDWQRQLASLPSNTEVAARFDLLNKIAVKQLELGETEEAIEHLQQCLALVPENASALADRVEYQLAVAYLRRAEVENCIHCANGESCTLPIRAGGVHQFTSGSQGAIKHLTSVLERNPDHVAAQWLLNLAYMTLGGYPDDVPAKFLVPPGLFEGHEDFPRFENIAQQLGLNEHGLSGGIIVDDFNGDGRLDVVTSQWSTSGQLRIYMGQPDDTFIERTEEAGLTGIYGGLNIIQADYDNDGDLDILVLRGGWWGDVGRIPNSLLANDGTGRFRDVTFEVGLGEVHYPTQTASWADYDNDGDLDLFIGNEDFPCQLFENNGRGYFTDVAQKAGVADGGYAKAVIWGDYDGDRYPDLYVSNLAGPNRLFRNNRDGTFTDVAAELGVEGPTRSFPAWFWDFNNDGVLDLFVAAYTSNIAAFAADYLGRSHQGETDRLYQGDGQGGFRDVSREMNVRRVTVPMGSNFGDLNNNGFLDYYLGTGEPNYDALMPNRMFLNQRGQGFADVSTAGGFAHLQKGHGVAFADFDEDGDLDVFIVVGGAYPGDAFPNAVFENPGFGNHWLTISLVGEISNRLGVGARIRAVVEEGGEERSIYRWINSGGTFGANPLRAHIGLGQATKVNTLEVYWPTSDITQTFTNVPADQSIQIVEGRDQWQVNVSNQ